MRHFECLYSIAIEHDGVVTSADAARAGIATSEIARYCKDGRLERVGYGVYRPRHYVPTRLTRYAAALALVGDGAFLHGISVVRMLGLVREDAGEGGAVHVATTRRVRRKLPGWLSVQRVPSSSVCVEYDGLSAQPVGEALLESSGSLDAPALRYAVERAFGEGLLAQDQYAALGMRLAPLPAWRPASEHEVPTARRTARAPRTPEG